MNFSKFFCFLFLLINFSSLFSLVLTQEKEPFTAKDMHLLNRLSSIIPSPDNKYLVYVNTLWDEESQNYFTNLKYIPSPSFSSESKSNVEPTDITPPLLGRSDSEPIFSSEYPNFLFFIRTENGSSNIFYVDFPPSETSEPKQLTKYEISVSNIKMEKNILVFSADVYYVCEDFACTKEKDDEVAARGSNTYSIYTKLMMRHWDFWYTEGKSSHPFYQKLKKTDNLPNLDGKPVDMMKSMKYCSPPLENGSGEFSISADEKLVAFSAHSKDEKMSYNTKWEIYLYDIENKKLNLLTEEEKGRCQSPSFKPNDTENKLLAFLCMDNYGLESDELKFRVYYPLNGKMEKETIPITQTKSGFIWDNQGDIKFIVNTVDAGRITLLSYDFTKRDDIKEAYFYLTKDSNSYGLPLIISEDGSQMVIDFNSFTHANLLGLIKLKPDSGLYEASVYYDANSEVMKKFEMVEAEWFSFTGSNDDEVQGWIMKPINFKEGRKYPLAFLIHGGPEGAWDPAWSYRWNPNLWTNHGYAVVMINPHGSSGMGIDFQNAVRNNWGGWPFQDLMLGLDHVLKTYEWIDGDRVGGCGASYGGYMVNWIQGHNDEGKFKCLVTHDGVFSTITMFYATEEMWFPMSEYCPHNQWGCKPYNDEERIGYETYNPEYFAQNWKTPHLIIHGSRDYRIPITEGISAFTTLQIKGVPSRFLHFPDENHWVLKPSNSIKWYEEVLGWLDKYLENS